MNVITKIRDCEKLLDPAIASRVVEVRSNEFFPLIEISKTCHCMGSSFGISITSRFQEVPDEMGYVNIEVKHNKDFSVICNPSGLIKNDGGSHLYFNLDDVNGEEDLFMLSTVLQTFDITMKEVELFKKIWSLYFDQSK